MHLAGMSLTFEHIRAALAAPPLGPRSDHDLDPEIKARQFPGLVQRPAAVLCPIVERRGGLHVVLTRRAGHLPHHAGQIAFPGGKVEPGDRSPLETALREADEEIGLGRDMVEVLGTLDPYLTSTGFRITPFVGAVDPRWRPFPDAGEVEEVFEVPLDYLMDPANRERHRHERDGLVRHYYAMPWRDYFIWGATAGMLKGLADRLEHVLREGAG